MEKFSSRPKSSSPLTVSKGRNAAPSPVSFSSNQASHKLQDCESAMARFSTFNDKKLDKLESLRKEQLIQEIRSLQDRPNINETSKKIFKNYIPIYKRLNEVVKTKNEHIKSLQLESELSKKSNFKANCTFKPVTLSTSTRSPEQFAEQTNSWYIKKKQQHEYMKKKHQEEINLEVTLKPEISQKSLLLASNRSSTPVFERLYYLKPDEAKEIGSFHPSVTPESQKILEGKRSGPIFDRLYGLRKVKPQESVTPKKKIKKNKSLVLIKDGKYKINSCDGPIFDLPVNLVHCLNSKFVDSILSKDICINKSTL